MANGDMRNPNIIQMKINAIIVYNFILLYSKFEKIIKEIFQKRWSKTDLHIRSRIYYYLGWVGSEVKAIDYDSYQVIKEIHKFDEDKLIKQLSIIQIIKLDKNENFIDEFDNMIQSKQVRALKFDLHDSCIKLIKMRNKIAHEFKTLKFKTCDYIEILSVEKLKENQEEWLKDCDIDKLSEENKIIFSNYIYMKDIVANLERIQLDDNKTVG